MRRIFDEEFQQLRDSDQYYAGTIFRNRDEEVHKYRNRESMDEEILVYRLYAAVHEQYQGVLNIDGTEIWLFSCEVPNQGKRLSYRTKKRRADLVGLRQDGSLIVFECKGPQNCDDSPFYGLLEGLDYLGCLLTRQNFASLNEDLQDWIAEHQVSPTGFSSVVPNWPSFSIAPQAQHSVIVLAPQSYYDLHVLDSAGRPKDWWLLSDRRVPSESHELAVGLDFAVVDYDKGTASWLASSAFPASTTAIITQPAVPRVEAQQLPRSLIWRNGDEEVAVTRVRQGGKNTRVRLPNGTTQVVPNTQLHPAS
jgi:hypothetical protein